MSYEYPYTLLPESYFQEVINYQMGSYIIWHPDGKGDWCHFPIPSMAREDLDQSTYGTFHWDARWIREAELALDLGGCLDSGLL
jgi:hypothetical protein